MGNKGKALGFPVALSVPSDSVLSAPPFPAVCSKRMESFSSSAKAHVLEHKNFLLSQKPVLSTVALKWQNLLPFHRCSNRFVLCGLALACHLRKPPRIPAEREKPTEVVHIRRAQS